MWHNRNAVYKQVNIMTNNYNAIAGFYDGLSKLVFQKSIVDAQKFLVRYIPANSNILIVGGGTGWILEAIANLHQSNISITYVEKSAKMIALSKKRNYKSNTVEFINEAIEDFVTNKMFDVIFTAFVFDNFKPDKIESIFIKLHKHLQPNGCWLYADFIYTEHSKLWQRLLLKTMYLFFKLTCNIETQQLINVENHFDKDYNKTAAAFFYNNFIQSKVYQKK